MPPPPKHPQTQSQLIQSSDDEDQEDTCEHYVLKLLVVGQPAVGKTCVIWRYVNGTFTPHYKTTIGVDFGLKVIKWTSDKIVRLQFWDLSGQERFNSMSRVYFKEAVGAFVVFDVTQPKTLEMAVHWKKDIDSKVKVGEDQKNIPVVLLANKIDLVSKSYPQTHRRTLDQFCDQYGFIGWMPTSAKEGDHIEDAVRSLVDVIFRTNNDLNKEQRTEEGTVQLGQPEKESPNNQANNGSCCP
jgi:small GTP-binding protein